LGFLFLMNDHDIRFMQRALELARKGIGLSSPNPTVGCVIVNDGHVVGEGFHQYDWRDHAEIVALNTAGEKSRGATAYVTLEPCNFTGRTGPCTQALLDADIARVVAATPDPNPKVAGAGLESLRAAGVTVDSGVCEPEARRLNQGFACWIRHSRPFVTLKSALTLDGQLALPRKKKSGDRDWITSEESRAEVHRLRHASDALLTGIGTILADDPFLTDRSGLARRRPLLRVILDSRLRLSANSRIVKSADDDLLVLTAAPLKSPKARKLQNTGVELLRIPRWQGKLDLNTVLQELGRREILNVLLEAGPRLNAAALSASLVDRLFLFHAPKIAGHTKVPFAVPSAGARTRPALHPRETQLLQFGGDFAADLLLHNHFDS
jgi:diaminohydroxyphosphoribosylaminopyrimidine deaminase / 5-amino-6-(5-phosphoribosylamino)uracil reductase